MDFVFTRSQENIDSSFVDEVYYNLNNNQMAVVLRDNGETRNYVYEDVPAYVYEAFVSSGSKGAYYNTVVKSGYGPGEEVSILLPKPVAPQVSSSVGPQRITVLPPKNDTSEYSVIWEYGSRKHVFESVAKDDVSAVDELVVNLTNLGLSGAKVVSVTRKVEHVV